MTEGSHTAQDGPERMSPLWNSAAGVLTIRPPGVGESMSLRDAALTFVVGAALVSPGSLNPSERIPTHYPKLLMMMGVFGLFFGGLMLGIALLTGAGHRRAARDFLRSVEADSWENLARRAWAAARLKSVWTLRSDPRRGVHEAEWFGCDAPAGESRSRPSVIVASRADFALHVIGGDEDVHEPVEVGVSRRLAPSERARRVRQLAGFVIGAAFVGLIFNRVGIPLHFWFAWLIGHAVYVMYRLGWGPIAMNSAVASIGSLEVIRWGSRSMFTTNDSVLVIEVVNLHAAVIRIGKDKAGDAEAVSRRGRRAAEQVRVHAVRRDGRLASLSFDGAHDPGLSDLLARWLHGGGVEGAWTMSDEPDLDGADRADSADGAEVASETGAGVVHDRRGEAVE